MFFLNMVKTKCYFLNMSVKSHVGQVCLAMMVKNEEKTILKSLNSCKRVVTHVKIYDTGSTDDTLNIIQQKQKPCTFLIFVLRTSDALS